MNASLPAPAWPYGFAHARGVVVLRESPEGFHLGLRADADPAVLLEARRVLGRPVSFDRIDATRFDRHLSELYADADLGRTAEGELADAHADLDALAGDIPATADLLDSQDDAPVIRLINGLLAEAARLGASDVHVEPSERQLRIRFRIDGVMRQVLELPTRMSPLLVSRVKVMARLDIAEKRVPQDGRISVSMGSRALDVRVSTLPARGGERVVMRLLDKEQGAVPLPALGMAAPVLRAYEHALGLPNGIVLVCGPTGSGKTTTLYAGLSHLNDGHRTLLTVEDPVEYAIDGVGQTQVHAKVGMTFAAGLRAILRQDPDIVMVGEIRDPETARIAVQASLTGHLVLSTVHTNDAAGAVTRLRDMGIEPFLLASTLRLVVAQRLVRRLCPHCRAPRPVDGLARPLMGEAFEGVLFQAVGCDHCRHTGYAGRVGIHEAMVVDERMRGLIGADASEDAIAAHAFAQAPRLADAIRARVAAGDTTIEEALRVTRQELAPDAGI